MYALINFLLSENKKKNYCLFKAPELVYEKNLYNTGQLPKFREDLYKIEKSDFFLIPTAEVTLVNIVKKNLTEEELPLKLCSYSSCFRAEAGAAGQESKGIRFHQFNKVELVKIVKPDESYLELKRMVEEVCDILDLLKISYRVMDLCYKDLDFSAAKTYDIEIWLPVSKKWLEISSCSNCEDFQSRRAKIRVKKSEEKYYPHTLNGSALAIDRLIVALCEYYYNKEKNKLEYPEVLKKYFVI